MPRVTWKAYGYVLGPNGLTVHVALKSVGDPAGPNRTACQIVKLAHLGRVEAVNSHGLICRGCKRALARKGLVEP